MCVFNYLLFYFNQNKFSVYYLPAEEKNQQNNQ